MQAEPGDDVAVDGEAGSDPVAVPVEAEVVRPVPRVRKDRFFVRAAGAVPPAFGRLSRQVWSTLVGGWHDIEPVVTRARGSMAEAVDRAGAIVRSAPRRARARIARLWATRHGRQ